MFEYDNGKMKSKKGFIQNSTPVNRNKSLNPNPNVNVDLKYHTKVIQIMMDVIDQFDISINK